MPKEDHVFKKRFVEKNAEANEGQEQDDSQSKLDAFVWEETEEGPDSNVPLQPEFFEIDKCSEIIMAYILNTLSGDHFGGSDDRGAHFSIPIALSIHSLLTERFSEQWTLDSRLLIFKGIQEQLTEKLNENDNKVNLNKCIGEALPPSRKRFSSDEIILHDDALAVDGESDSITVEIPIHFESNP